MRSTTTRPLAVLTLALALGCSRTPEVEPTPEPLPALSEVDYTPNTGALRRLTAAQYGNSVRDLLGSPLVVPTRLEQDDASVGLFSIGARLTTISPRGAELYEQAAYDLAEQALLDPDRRGDLVGCTPSGPDDRACAESFVAEFGRRAFRRALTPEEVDRFASLIIQASGVTGDFYSGAVYGAAGILQSPKFLFRREVGDRELDDGTRTYSNDEMAARLSYYLWNTTPDDALLDAAAAGELTDDAGLRAQVDRMLADPRARQGVRNFFTELYKLYELDTITKATEVFPQMSAEVGAAAREETLLGLEYLIFDERGDYRDILTTRRTFVDRRLAAIYGIPAPAREGFAMAMLPEDSPRAGILGQVSTLAYHSHPVASSPTLRGIFVRETLLCQPIPEAPADVDTSIPEPSGEAVTLRERVAEHLEVVECAGCHSLVDPIGLALENYDGLGVWRELDNGAPIDATGELDGAPFDGPYELATALRDHPRFGSCLTRQLYAYATGYTPERKDQDLIDALTERFVRSDFDVLTLMTEVAMSPAFRKAQHPDAQGMGSGEEE